MDSIDSDFGRALKFVNEGTDSSNFNNNIKLKLYGLYKRATMGKCSEVGGNRPFFMNKVATSKYDAWMSFDNIESNKCKRLYVSIIKEHSDFV